MNKYLPLIVSVGLLSSGVTHADEQTRNLQSALKDAGFYFGPINGEKNVETSAAIRRYQIRNSLQVTGEFNQETIDALTKSQTPSVQSSEAAPESETAPSSPAVPQSRPATPPVIDHQPALESQPGVDRQPAPDLQSDSISRLFHKSPYETAPPPVQQETLRRVQDKLARKGFYRGPLDGLPTENLLRSIAAYQNARGLRPSGRLDMDTLHEMRLLPGEEGSPFGTGQSRPKQRIYRGIEVR